MQTGLIVETGEAREVHHFALLIGYGASVVNPYLSYAIIYELVQTRKISSPYPHARKNYIESINKGLLKIISKMGISTLRSYFGAQLFEAIGIKRHSTRNSVKPLKFMPEYILTGKRESAMHGIRKPLVYFNGHHPQITTKNTRNSRISAIL